MPVPVAEEAFRPGTLRTGGNGLLAAAGASIVGGIAVVVTRFAVREIDPLLLAFLRYAIGSACLLPFALRTRGPRIARGDLAPVAALGTIFFGAFPWSFSAALKYTTAAHGALVLSIVPLLTLLCSGLLGTERLTAGKLLGVTLAFLGVAFVLADTAAIPPGSRGTVAGDLLMLLAAGCGAVYNVCSQRYLRAYPRLSVTVWAMLAGTIALLPPVAFVRSADLSRVDPATWLLVLLLGVVGAAVAAAWLARALAFMTPTGVAVFIPLNPLVAVGLGVAVLGEPVTWRMIAGFACVLTGIGVVNWQRRRPTGAAWCTPAGPVRPDGR